MWIDQEKKMTANGSLHPERCILVTGGAGYIGTHTSLQLLLDGYKVVIMDNLSRSCEEAVRRVVNLAGKQGKNLVFHKVCVYLKSRTPLRPLSKFCTPRLVADTMQRILFSAIGFVDPELHFISPDCLLLLKMPLNSRVFPSSFTHAAYL